MAKYKKDVQEFNKDASLSCKQANEINLYLKLLKYEASCKGVAARLSGGGGHKSTPEVY